MYPFINTSNKLKSLRHCLMQDNLQGFLIPMADAFQSEYVPLYANYIKWLTGFTGSAGFVVLSLTDAAFFTDGRYALQAPQQVTSELFDHHNFTFKEVISWIQSHVSPHQRVGFDPWLHTIDQIQSLQQALDPYFLQLVPVSQNPLDKIWVDKPLPETHPIFLLEEKYTGKSSLQKREDVTQKLGAKESLFLTDAPSIAWLLNMRAWDLPHTPIALCYAMVHKDKTVDVFIDLQKVPADLQQLLEKDGIYFYEIESLEDKLHTLSSQKMSLLLPSKETPYKILELCQNAHVPTPFIPNPCALLKACKNAIELEGFRQAHREDGIALIRFLKFIDQEGPKGTLTESTAVEHLTSLRKESPLLERLSFNVISGVNQNAAFIHYSVSSETCASLKVGDIYLVDSGGQYKMGTTDVSRTLIIGHQATAQQKRNFTLVLKGHIALASTPFPIGTTGTQLDALARQYLWKNGLDFEHGTGHGVGHFLNVHEGPQSISKNPMNTTPLLPGMIVSNEPGYYEQGQYGIRIENLIAVVPSQITNRLNMLEFETLTLVPIDKNLIDLSLLTPGERDWLNTYHARIYETLSSRLDDETRDWLEKATSPLS
jgi:Xaa-Pro aminopeptidase